MRDTTMDEKDKTLFKQPGAGDSTVLKPTPGRKGGMDMRPPPVTPSYTPEPIAAAGAAPQGRVDLSAF
ncbi:MAG TPA: hypothetical protein PKC70_16725, partial [Cellvibrionaceae bacterium]|nr:hypothetical protein [Cellvibrionaceae bacterium]